MTALEIKNSTLETASLSYIKCQENTFYIMRLHTLINVIVCNNQKGGNEDD